MATPEQIKIRIQAQDDASAKLDKIGKNIDKVGKSAKVTREQSRSLGGALGGVGRGAGQAGIQVQQFVGQIQGGVNPMVALSQQATDLGFVLGVPLAGAIVGIGASIAASLLPSLMAASKSFADLSKEIKAVGLDLDDLPAEVVAAETRRLEEAASDAKEAFKSQEEAIQDLNRRLQEEITLYENQGLTTEQVKRQTTGLRGEIERLSEKMPNLTTEVIISTARLKNFRDEVAGNENSMKEWYKSLEDAEIRTRKFIRTTAGMEGIFPTALVTDEDPVNDLMPIWQETDKVTASQQMLGKEVKKTAMTMSDVGQRGIQGMEDSLVDLISGTKSASEAFGNMARSIINDLIRMYVQQKITAPLFNAMFGQSATQYTTVSGSATPTVGNPDVYFEGGGYTGRGSRSGGVDGKGGFNAILHPNETVIDHSKGQGMGGSPVNVTLNISTGVAQTVRTEIQSMLPMITEATKSAVVDAKRRGGSFARGMA